MQLNYRLRTCNIVSKKKPIVLLHGLFGNLSNLGIIAENLSKKHCIVQVDLRNHGNSPHEEYMSYSIMATDIVALLDQLLIKECIIIGCSMGGKVAMTLCMSAAQRISKAIILDIAPVKYEMLQHEDIFHAIECVNISNVKNRSEAAKIMQQHLSDNVLISFLLKSFHQGLWNFNFSSIKNNYVFIKDWNTYFTWWGPILFIKGALSSYIKDSYLSDIYHQFPQAHISLVPNSGHWVHWDNTVYVMNLINDFIDC